MTKKKSLKQKAVGLLSAAAILTSIAIPAWATNLMPEKMMDIYMDSIYDNGAAVVADFSQIDDMNVQFDDTEITLPGAGEKAIAVSRDTENGLFDMQIGLPSGNENIDLLSDRAVYEEDGYIQAVQVADGDIHIVTSILNYKSQDEFAYDFDLPAGAYMEYADYGVDNSVLIYDENGNAMYTLVPGIAKDANGKEVDFVWNLQGNTLVHGVAEGQDVAYPVNISVNAARAYTIGHYFTSYSASPNSSGYKVSLTPNWSNLYASGTPAGFSSHKAASWSAVYNYYYTNSWWKNTACMKSQYECHYNYCTSFGPYDYCDTWDLETWRTGTANSSNSCNP
jgi:hypothetical protein